MASHTSPTIAEVPPRHPAGTPPFWLDHLADGCLHLDPDLTVLYLNTAFAQAFARPASNLIGRQLPDLLEGGNNAPVCRVALAALRAVCCQEADEAAGDRWFHLRAQPVPEGVVVTRTDITARRQLEARLLLDALHCRRVLEQLPTIHWAVDSELRFTHSFGAGLAAIGLVDGEAKGLTLFEYLQTDDPTFLTISMHRRALSGERVRYADTNRGRQFDVSLEPLREPGGRISGVLGLAHDVTERHVAAEQRASLQEQLLLAQKRESLGVLAVGVAHDFNNLLSAIVGSASLLLRELAPGGARESAALIKKAAERAADVTRQMLVYAGKNIPARRPLDLNDTVREHLPLITAAMTGGVTLKICLAERLSPVFADPGQIQQVVMNLVLNAREATATRGGVVTLSTDQSEGDSCVCLEVRDEGCGMSPAVVSRMFDPFFTTKGRGRGLGLSAVQGIVQAHGGEVKVQSEPGRGTTFRVLLPAGEAAPTSRGNGPL